LVRGCEKPDVDASCGYTFRMREEQQIFDDLEALCASPGYMHAIAYFCFRDSIIRYKDELSAEDMRYLFSENRLIRTEISTLLGLTIKHDLDYTLPSEKVLQLYLDRTEELLEEMHRAINDEPIPSASLRLDGHCRARKYVQKARSWFGICLSANDESVRFGVNVDQQWEANPEMAAITRNMRKSGDTAKIDGHSGNNRRKVGRNQVCPCGSGLKYKKCCLK
jgi:predicted DNA-binding protein with PD1-like motif